MNTKEFEDEIYQNSNHNGGGLAHNLTGRYESNRNALARLDSEKRTAGQVAKSLRKSGHKIYAKEIKEFCEEWHHAGFKPRKIGGGMAKTYYTIKTDQEMLDLLEEQKEKEQQKAYYFTWVWEGYKPAYKVLLFVEGNCRELEQDKNAVELTKQQFLKAKHKGGKIYKGWDQPEFDQIVL